jgi:DNA-binding response OmpR family regulator
MEEGTPRRRILVMDDDPEIRILLRQFLEEAAFEVDEAEGGREGLRKHGERPYDLVIADLFMPEGDGLEFLTKVRPKAVGLPVIAISGGSVHFHLEGLDLARLLGAARTIPKPFSPSEVVVAAKELLGILPRA